MKVLVTGGTGLIGKEVVNALAKAGHSVVVLTRDLARTTHSSIQCQFIQGDLTKDTADLPTDIDAVVHLMGESVADGAWTPEKKKILRDSRILATQNLRKSFKKLPSVVVAASAIGYYGDRGDEDLDENSSEGHDFLAQLCIDWENEVRKISADGVRTVSVRTGIVLSKKGGMLAMVLRPFKFGVGGPMAGGQAWMSWIHVDDMVGIYLHALSGNMNGPLNGAAPNPVRNIDFTKTLAKILRRPAFLPLPKFALQLVFGEKAEMLIGSQKVFPKKTMDTGYKFKFSNLEEALRAEVSP